jgi:hypothetical protein
LRSGRLENVADGPSGGNADGMPRHPAEGV